MSKGFVKGDPRLKPLDFDDQPESDAIINFICDMLEVYREEMNCFANDRGGQTFSRNLIVTETLPDGSKANVDLEHTWYNAISAKEQTSGFPVEEKRQT